VRRRALLLLSGASLAAFLASCDAHRGEASSDEKGPGAEAPVLVRLGKFDRGEISLFGIRGWDPMRLKGRLSAMPQDAVLGRETRCLEHLRYFACLQGLSAAEARHAAARALDEVGLADRGNDKAKTLSHGMLRRLAIAQALLGKPELVLLDEPTSGLDPRHAHELRELLRRSRSGRTVVISSHNLGELESLCDHVAFVDRGVTVGGGATNEITGKDQEIEIQLGLGPAPIEAVTRALPGDTVTYHADGRTLRIAFRPSPDREVEDVVNVALRTLLDGGARISSVRRGASLEKRFLELT
jgi:ABC-type multidrug transport system ATPase subunit